MYKANYIIRVTVIFYSNCIWKLVTIYNIKIYNISKFCMGHKSSCVLFTEVKAVQLLPFSPLHILKKTEPTADLVSENTCGMRN